jgi:hypothetical protein
MTKVVNVSERGVISVEDEPRAIEALGGIPTYEEAHLGPVFAAAVDRYVLCKDDMEALKQEKDSCSERIIRAMAQGGHRKVSVKKTVVTLVDSTRNSLSREKLVENLIASGMPASKVNEVLQASETATNFTFIRIDVLKAKNGRSANR